MPTLCGRCVYSNLEGGHGLPQVAVPPVVNSCFIRNLNRGIRYPHLSRETRVKMKIYSTYPEVTRS